MSNMSSDRLLKRGCVCVAKSPLNTSEEISTKTVDMNMVLYTLGVCISGVQKSKVVLRQWLFKCADSTQKLNEGPMLPVLEIIQPLKFKIVLYHLRGLFFQTHHFSIHSTIILGVIQTGSGKDASMCANRSFIDHSTVRGTTPSFSWIFSPSLHYEHYILQNTAGCTKPERFSEGCHSVSGKRTKSITVAEVVLAGWGTEHTIKRQMTTHHDSWRHWTLHTDETEWVFEDLTVEFSISFIHFHSPAISCMGLTCSILVDLWPEQTAHFVWHMNISQSQDFDLQYTVSAPTLNPTLTGPSLNYSLRPRLSTNGSRQHVQISFHVLL